jgi:hypothetical protein
MSDDYDNPWKEAIEQYFKEFTAFFFPKAYKKINWSKGYVFLDKELRKIMRKAEISRKYVDKLVQVWLKNKSEIWAAVHIDVQSQSEKDFSKRMYVYNYRLFDRYDRHAASFAVLGDADTNWRPSVFRQKLMDCEVRFRFPIVKLSDYRYEGLEKSSNPFAIVVMAHLKTQETAKDDPKRLKEKLEIVRHLYRKGFSKQDILNLFRFIDWIMDLPEDMDRIFSDELEAEEKEGKMPYITSVERVGYKRGKQEGKQEGILEGILKAIGLGLEIKFGKPGLRLMKKISEIRDMETLDAICEGLKKVSEIKELRQIYEK